MTEREYRLRSRIDELARKHDLLRRLLGEKVRLPRSPTLRCSYCGAPSLAVACPAHHDLLTLDPLAPGNEPSLIYQ